MPSGTDQILSALGHSYKPRDRSSHFLYHTSETLNAVYDKVVSAMTADYVLGLESVDVSIEGLAWKGGGHRPSAQNKSPLLGKFASLSNSFRSIAM